MKPKILTRLANIVAKLAGSPDYDPSVKPITPLEFYADRLPVVPVPSSRDDGKMLVAYGEGTYALVQPTQPAVTPEDVVSAFESMSDEQKESVMEELGVAPAPLVATFSGSTAGGNAACDKTFDEISAAGNNIVLQYAYGAMKFHLNTSFTVREYRGVYFSMANPAVPSDGYILIKVVIDSDSIYCEFTQI